MDFFGLGSAAEMETPLGKLVGSATDPLLLGPDWAKNLEICDNISSFPEATEVVKAVFHQLKSSDAKVVQLALTLIDTCIQNNWTHVPQAINKSFMEEMVNISRGRKGYQNQEEALRLLQVWGRRFERKQAEVPLFFETYMALRAQGVAFPPEEEENTAAQTSAKAGAGAGSSNKGSQEEVSREDPNQKITADLNTVLDKVRLCREMLPQAQAQGGDDLLREVVGFLEACQDRMLELIEAGMAGAEGGAVLSEEVFEQCLRVNDALTRTLEAEKDGVVIAVDDESTIPIGAEQASSSGSSGLTTSLLDEEIDEFATLTLKTSSKKAGGGGGKKIPTIKGPGNSSTQGRAKSSGAGLLVPPPTPSQQKPQQTQQQTQQQQQAGLDFLGGGPPATSLSQSTAGSNNPFNTDSPPSSVPASSKPAPTLLPPPQQPAARVSSSTNPLLTTSPPPPPEDDLLSLFTTAPPASTTAASTSSASPQGLGSSQMTDDEFESFLNSPK